MGYKGWEEFNPAQKGYKDPRKQLQGSKNRLRGLTFENMIDLLLFAIPPQKTGRKGVIL